jgi:hypothetical protein
MVIDMVNEKMNVNIYHSTYKRQLMDEIKKVALVKTKTESLGDSKRTFELTYIDGWLESTISNEIEKEFFGIDGNTIVFSSCKESDGSFLKFHLKRMPEPQFLIFNLLKQNVVKLPAHGKVMVESRKRKVYEVELSENCEYDMEQLKTTPPDSSIECYINTKVNPWVCVMIVVHYPDGFNESDHDVKQSQLKF